MFNLSLEEMLPDINILGDFVPNSESNEYFDIFTVSLIHRRIPASTIAIEVAKDIKKCENEKVRNYYFDMSKDIPIATPRVITQHTELLYKGKGFSGHLIKTANKIYSNMLNSPLYSDTVFFESKYRNKTIKPGKRVWEKLVEEGLAKYIPFEGDDRWKMK